MRNDKILLTATLLLCAGLLLPSLLHSGQKAGQKNKDAVSAPVVPAGMKLVWSDEFNGPGINLSNWTYETKATGWSQKWNNEYQNYTDNGTNGPNAFVSNGNLVILAVKTNDRNSFNSYHSARLTTMKTASWKFGIIAARIKMPYGNGMWPAFWMLGTNSPITAWPYCGEIDIAEMIGGTTGEKNGGGDNAVSAALHGPNYSGDTAKQAYHMKTNGRLADDYHVYWIDWTPSSITWYFDSTPCLNVRSADVNTWVFEHDFYIILNLAVGGNWPGYPDRTTVFPQAMTVDWVRVYQ